MAENTTGLEPGESTSTESDTGPDVQQEGDPRASTDPVKTAPGVVPSLDAPLRAPSPAAPEN